MTSRAQQGSPAISQRKQLSYEKKHETNSSPYASGGGAAALLQQDIPAIANRTRPSDAKQRHNPSVGMTPLAAKIEGRPSDAKQRHNPSAGMIPVSRRELPSPGRGRPSDAKQSRNPSAGMVPLARQGSPAIAGRKRPSDDKQRHNPSAGMVPISRQSVASLPTHVQPSDGKQRNNPSAGMLPNNGRPRLFQSQQQRNSKMKDPPTSVSSLQPPQQTQTQSLTQSRPSDEKAAFRRRQDDSGRNLVRRQPSLGDQAYIQSGSSSSRSFAENKKTDGNALFHQIASNESQQDAQMDSSHSREASVDSGLDLDEDIRNTILAQSSPRRMLADAARAKSVASEAPPSNSADAPMAATEKVADDDDATTVSVSLASESETSFSTFDEKAAYRKAASLLPGQLKRSDSLSTANSGVDLSDNFRNSIINRASAHAVARKRTSAAEVLRQSLHEESDVSVTVDEMTSEKEAMKFARSAALADDTMRKERVTTSSTHTLPGAVSMDSESDHTMAKTLSPAAAAAAAAVANIPDDVDGTSNFSISSETMAGNTASHRETERSDHGELINMEAQAGVPVVLPGAFAIDGTEPTPNRSGYDSEYEEDSVEIASQASSNGHNNNGNNDVDDDCDPEAAPPVVIPSTPLDAQLYEESAAVAALSAQAASEAEAELKRLQKQRLYRLIFGALVCAVIVIAASVTLGIMLPRSDGGNSGNVSPDGCPAIVGWTGSGRSIFGPTEDDGIMFGFSMSMSADGGRMVVGLPGLDKDSSETKVGGAMILDFNGTDWVETALLEGPGANAQAGIAVDISRDGTLVAIGSPFLNGGEAAVYEQIADEGWSESFVINSTDSDPTNGRFGAALALSTNGDVLAVSDRNAFENAGMVQVFRRDQDGWTQLGDDIRGEELNDFFGWAVSLSSDGTRLAVTARGAQNFAGAVRVYDFVGASWVKTASLDGEQPREDFGSSIALTPDGKTLAVGATGFSQGDEMIEVGRVTVFTVNEQTKAWDQVGNGMEGTNAFDSFGSAVRISDAANVLAIGVPEYDLCGDDSGSVDVFKFDGETWSKVGSSLGDTATNEGSEFGFSVAMSADGTTVAGGAPSATFNGFLGDVGHIRVFDFVEAVGDE